MDELNLKQTIIACLKSESTYPAALPLSYAWLSTPIGSMIAIASEKELYLLEFLNRRHLLEEITTLQMLTQGVVKEASNPVIAQLTKEIDEYFLGTRQSFATPLKVFGTPFQQEAWQALHTIPFGTTRSYREQAYSLDKPRAFRAVALANSKNRLAIIVPCHRVVNHNGALGGYAAGLEKKEWLLEHEKRCATNSHMDLRKL